MREFRYASYDTRFSSKTLGLKMKSRACFREVFDSGDISAKEAVDYKIILFKGIKHQASDNLHNACFMSSRQLRGYLNIAKNTVKDDCEFNFRIINNPKKDYLTLKVSILGRIFYHKYLLTWIRYSYEYPYNTLLMDTYSLRNSSPTYRFLSTSNLLLLTFSAYDGIGTGHSYTGRGKFMSNKELSEKLKYCSKLRGYEGNLNNIFEESTNSLKRIEFSYNKFDYYDIEYWKDNDILEKRIKVYDKNYKILSK